MNSQFTRTQRLLGRSSMEILAGSRIAVFGIGGVGGYVVEALARSGVGALDLIDPDKVALSNLNRQIIALRSTIGRYKTDVMRERILDINPDVTVRTYQCFYLPEEADRFDFASYDYVVDAVDTVTAKIDIILQSQRAGVPVISSMGAGNKLDPTAFVVSDIYETDVDPLARVMRRELRKRGVQKLKVVYSREKALTPFPDHSKEEGSVIAAKREVPGSTAFVPSAAGLIIASRIVRDLTEVSMCRERTRQESEQ